ncbi:MAG: hypothetical protein ABL908_11565 [Hyphomicrobium sp.]
MADGSIGINYPEFPDSSSGVASAKRTVVVRLAKPDDVDAVFVVLTQAHRESPIPLPQLDAPRFRHWALQVISTGYTWIATDEDRVVGVLMCGVAYKPWTPNAVFLETLHCYIRPTYRKSRVFDELISKAKAASDATGLNLHVEIDYGDRPDAKDRLMRTKGLKYVGGKHLYLTKAG